MRIAFLGTPDFAVESLRALISAGHTLCVFTQPDKPQGRHATLTPPPVKAEAAKYDIPVYQFDRISSPEGVQALKTFAPELMVTAAFGQILSAEVLAIPPHGCINVHGSLLPKYRGAAPIQWSVINGDAVTGVTTMLTDIGLDTGDMLLKRETPIDPDETAGELFDRLCKLGAELLLDTIDALQKGELHPEKQDEAIATRCGMLKKEHGKIDFTATAQQVHDLVRGVNPWPGAYAMLEDKPLKIWRTRMTDQPAPEGAAPGLCFGDTKTGLFVMAKDRPIEVMELQSVGGKRMQAKAYLCGKPLQGMYLK